MKRVYNEVKMNSTSGFFTPLIGSDIMATEQSTKICFVIAPIGKEGSEIRNRSDQILKHVIKPPVNECGYETVRADEMSKPGIITAQIIQSIVDSPLVIADLTGSNPNVFYELSLRHALKKPVVQIIQADQTIPFDVAGNRTIHVDHHDLDSVLKAKQDIVQQIRSVEQDPSDVDNPISAAIELESLRKSTNPLEKSNAEILSSLGEIKVALGELREEPRRYRIHPGVLEELLMTLSDIYDVLDSEEPDEKSERWEMIRSRMNRTDSLVHHLCMEARLPPDMFVRRDRGRRGFKVMGRELSSKD